jgi:hypothetical protein
MKQAKVIEKQLDDLILWDKNPRAIHEVDYKRLKNLIKELGLFKPFLVNQDNIILGGNMRYRVCKDLGYKEVYVSTVETKDETEMFSYALADNDRAGYYEEDKVADLVLENPTLKLDLFKLDLGKQVTLDELYKRFTGDELSDEYSQKLGEIIYEPKETNHKVSDLFQAETKFDKEINALKNEEIKEMLKARVAYFSNFDFAKIADYYAYQASLEEKILFEKLALVLLDRDQLIENGFSKIINYLEKNDKE